MSSGPNPAAAAWSMLRARRHTVPRPRPGAVDVVDHSGLAWILEACLGTGVASLVGNSNAIEA